MTGFVPTFFAQAAAEEGASSILSRIGSGLRQGVELYGNEDFRLLLASIVAALGLSLLMPGSGQRTRFFGAFCFAVGGVLVITTLPSLGIELTAFIFWVMAGITVFSAVGTVTSKSPVYCAIWFALTLLGVGGLMLVTGAQFLGVATVAVYAGAILVTFLFVLMLAQPEGHDFYDRISWGTIPRTLGCCAGMVLMGIIIWAARDSGASPAPAEENAVLVEAHVATLGGQLFTTHLLAVELAGVLLLAALVGAVAMAAFGNAATAGLKSQIEAAFDSPASQRSPPGAQAGTNSAGSNREGRDD